MRGENKCFSCQIKREGEKMQNTKKKKKKNGIIFDGKVPPAKIK